MKCFIICMFKLQILERLCKINSWESFIVISLTKGYKVITCWLQLHRLQTSYKLSVSARPSTSHSCRLSNVLSRSASQRSTGLTGNSQGAVVKTRQEDEEGVGLRAVLSARTWTLISWEELCERKPRCFIFKENKRNHRPFNATLFCCCIVTRDYRIQINFSGLYLEAQSFDKQRWFTCVLRGIIMFIYEHLMNMSRASQRFRCS